MKKRKVKFVPYRSRKGGSQPNRWKLVGANNKKVATGNEGFVNPVSRKDFERLKQLFAEAEYVEPKKKKK